MRNRKVRLFRSRFDWAGCWSPANRRRRWPIRRAISDESALSSRSAERPTTTVYGNRLRFDLGENVVERSHRLVRPLPCYRQIKDVFELLAERMVRDHPLDEPLARFWGQGPNRGPKTIGQPVRLDRHSHRPFAATSRWCDKQAVAIIPTARITIPSAESALLVTASWPPTARAPMASIAATASTGAHRSGRWRGPWLADVVGAD